MKSDHQPAIQALTGCRTLYTRLNQLSRDSLLLHFRFSRIGPIPWWLRGKESACRCRRPGFDPWVGKITLENKMAAHSGVLPGKSHGQSLVATIHGATKSQTEWRNSSSPSLGYPLFYPVSIYFSPTSFAISGKICYLGKMHTPSHFHPVYCLPSLAWISPEGRTFNILPDSNHTIRHFKWITF